MQTNPAVQQNGPRIRAVSPVGEERSNGAVKLGGIKRQIKLIGSRTFALWTFPLVALLKRKELAIPYP